MSCFHLREQGSPQGFVSGRSREHHRPQDRQQSAGPPVLSCYLQMAKVFPAAGARSKTG